MSEFLFRLPFSMLGAYIGSKHDGCLPIIVGSFIGCFVAEALMILL